jgi:DNA-binding NarL/FixJ family response regulator
MCEYCKDDPPRGHTCPKCGMSGVSETEQWLLNAQEERKEAAFQYEQAIINAVEQGWSNVKIAKVLHVTEVAIRSFRKRKGIN